MVREHDGEVAEMLEHEPQAGRYGIVAVELW